MRSAFFILLHGNVGYRSRDCHHYENHTARDCAYPYIAGHLVEQSVEYRQNKHHYDKSEYHVDEQPDLVVAAAPVAVEGRTRHEVANVIDKQYKREPEAVGKPADEQYLPLLPALSAYAAIYSD